MEKKNYKIIENRPELTKEEVLLGMNFSIVHAKISNPSLVSAHKVFTLKTVIYTGLTSIIIITGTFIYNKSSNAKKVQETIKENGLGKATPSISNINKVQSNSKTKTSAKKTNTNKTKYVKQVQTENDSVKEAKIEAFKKSMEQSLKLIESYRQLVIQGEAMSDLAIKYSEDPSSAKNGGRYDDVDPLNLVPEFMDVALSLKPNEISKVFKTQYGYHFMQLIERKGTLLSFRHILVIPK